MDLTETKKMFLKGVNMENQYIDISIKPFKTQIEVTGLKNTVIIDKCSLILEINEKPFLAFRVKNPNKKYKLHFNKNNEFWINENEINEILKMED